MDGEKRLGLLKWKLCVIFAPMSFSFAMVFTKAEILMKTCYNFTNLLEFIVRSVRSVVSDEMCEDNCEKY